jgi:hypothetical protein
MFSVPDEVNGDSEIREITQIQAKSWMIQLVQQVNNKHILAERVEFPPVAFDYETSILLIERKTIPLYSGRWFGVIITSR